mmetsp:Transcript_17658/g.38524  ORF Transcript_17658/g.38524 Transcript_17658/m.38524 type:complete len:104 (-) Transcript_17658:439-750(-)|eukprot:CAMPEP_0118935194 /NCGR_PEP_ID=MMETSP1169-20130426/15113_1 /TAXON_ID=36882 /ORGANISM="Pyramimonas obovata, Strain CCMP722" /LENGTH=103 /DNA_ID=CAMNT_0006878189 /DNA_START=61 /DNA_END=372 /DNA_ORIENTATION=+
MSSIAKRIIPTLDRILVQKVKPVTQTTGGILLPESASATKANLGVVVAAGPGSRSKNDGNVIPMTVKEGDKVLLPEYGGMNVKLEGEEFIVFRDEDVLAVLQE